MGLAASAAKFFSSLCVLLLGVLSLQSYGYFISAIVHDVKQQPALGTAGLYPASLFHDIIPSFVGHSTCRGAFGAITANNFFLAVQHSGLLPLVHALA